ncbi:MAG: hypothetical protein ACREYC_15220, partial [Gammaproteobacteria bacterium]
SEQNLGGRRPMEILANCFDRIVVNGYLSGLSRPEQVVYFFRQVGRGVGGQQGGALGADR